MNRQFWNDGYKKGIDYRQISDEELEAILSKFPVKPNSALDIGCGSGQLARGTEAERTSYANGFATKVFITNGDLSIGR